MYKNPKQPYSPMQPPPARNPLPPGAPAVPDPLRMQAIKALQIKQGQSFAGSPDPSSYQGAVPAKAATGVYRQQGTPAPQTSVPVGRAGPQPPNPGAYKNPNAIGVKPAVPQVGRGTLPPAPSPSQVQPRGATPPMPPPSADPRFVPPGGFLRPTGAHPKQEVDWKTDWEKAEAEKKAKEMAQAVPGIVAATPLINEDAHDANISMSDQISESLKDILQGKGTYGMSPEELAGAQNEIWKNAAQAKADMSQQMAARGFGASGVAAANLGNIDSQAVGALSDLAVKNKQMSIEEKLNQMKTLGSMYGQNLSEEDRMKIFEGQLGLEKDKFADSQAQQDEADAWTALSNILAGTGSGKYSAEAMAWAISQLSAGKPASEVLAGLSNMGQGIDGTIGVKPGGPAKSGSSASSGSGEDASGVLPPSGVDPKGTGLGKGVPSQWPQPANSWIDEGKSLEQWQNMMDVDKWQWVYEHGGN